MLVREIDPHIAYGCNTDTAKTRPCKGRKVKWYVRTSSTLGLQLTSVQWRREAQLPKLPPTKRILRLQHPPQLGRAHEEERGGELGLPGNIIRPGL